MRAGPESPVDRLLVPGESEAVILGPFLAHKNIHTGNDSERAVTASFLNALVFSDMLRARDIVVVTASLGGLEALTKLVADLPGDLPASVFIVLHIGAYDSALPKLLEAATRLPVRYARDGDDIQKAFVYLAPPDRHLILHEGKTRLANGPKENFTRPAADPLFRSAAVSYGRRVVGVVLTGKLDDGAAGLEAIDACGGYTIVQDPSDCVASDMPSNALEAVRADVVAPIAEIGAAILNALRGSVMAKRINVTARQRAEIETRVALTGRSSPEDLESLGQRSSLTCPDCGGVIWRVGEDLPLRYRCHTGHAFSAKSLDQEQTGATEKALWIAVRRLEERLLLAREELAAAVAANPHDVPCFSARVQRFQSSLETVRDMALNPDHIQ
jgi:two-component system chemotaxis response regulator CheB